MENSNNIECDDDRLNIAYFLIIVVSAIIAIFTIVSLVYSSNITDLKDVFSMILPVISTWVGAVIAYYFSKDNFKTAAKTNESLIKQLSFQEKLEAIKAEDAMTPLYKISYFDLKKDESEISLKNDIINQKFKESDRKRLPFLKDEKIVYMIHKSIIDEYLVKNTSEEQGINSHTLKDFLDESSYNAIATKSFETVKASENLSEVKKQMDKNKLCLDVFVTQDGTKESKVIGWITNVKLMSFAKI